jgi:hypothetical protein
MGNFYILIMDKNSRGNELIWYVTASSDDVGALQSLKNHDDQIVMQLIKNHYPGEAVTNVELINNHTNEREPGTIYEVHHI